MQVFRPTAYGPLFSYKLRYIVGFEFVDIAISTNPKPTIYRNLYENVGPGMVTPCGRHFKLR